MFDCGERRMPEIIRQGGVELQGQVVAVLFNHATVC
jgi:hypothetical protein